MGTIPSLGNPTSRTTTGAMTVVPVSYVFFRLLANAGTATAIVRDGGAGGTIRLTMTAVAGGADSFPPSPTPDIAIGFATDCYVTLSGSPLTFDAYPRS